MMNDLLFFRSHLKGRGGGDEDLRTVEATSPYYAVELFATYLPCGYPILLRETIVLLPTHLAF